MKPGRTPLPAALHLVNGNPSKKTAVDLKRELRPTIVMPDPPAHLLPEAQAEWLRQGPELIRLGLVTSLDRSALAIYCQAWARYVQAEEKLKELGDAALIETTPSGYKQIGVWLQISNRCAEAVHKYGRPFGFDPSARVGLDAVTPQLPLFGANEPGKKAATSQASQHFS